MKTNYILVKADFPGTEAEQREIIYEELEKGRWNMAQDPGRGVGTIWYAAAKKGLSESEFIQSAIRNFVACAQPYCNPRLMLQLTPMKPTFRNLAGF